MFITAAEARERLADIESRYEAGRIRQVHEWQIAQVRKLSRISWGDEDWTSPEGYDHSPDMGVHQYDGGGTFF